MVELELNSRGSRIGRKKTNCCSIKFGVVAVIGKRVDV